MIFHDPKTRVRAVVHGDDFTFLGFETELQQVKRELQRSYQLKVRAILGDDVKDEKTVVILNHKLVWKEDCIEHEADDQHARKVCRPRHPVCDQRSVQVHVETNETLLGEIKEDRPISLGTSQSNHAIQLKWKPGRHQGLH